MDEPLIPVDANGFRCWSDTFRYYGQGEIVLLSLFGPRNAVRSAWATLVQPDKKRTKTNPHIPIGSQNARRAEGRPYSTISTQLGSPRLAHTIMVDRRATRGGESFDHFFQVGPNPELRYFQRLSQLCSVPLRPTWAADLWEMGQVPRVEGHKTTAAIQACNGHGLPVYRISTVGEEWHLIVRDALQSGRLK